MHAPPPMSQHDGFTGATRFRLKRRWFAKPLLVLQVEERRIMIYPNAGNVSSRWRDVTIEDIARLAFEARDRTVAG